MDEPKKLGRGASALVGCFIGLTVLLLVGSVVALHAKRKEDEKRRRTVETLDALARAIDPASWGSPPEASGAGSDWTGQETLRSQIPQSVADNRKGLLSATEQGENAEVDAFFSGKLAKDGWGNPILYRCPGPVHARGFDFYSCGPNGKDDQGSFDDIVLGFDVAAVGSR